MIFTNFDYALMAVTALLVVNACNRGLSKELIHTLIFGGAMVAGCIYINQTGAAPTSSDPQAESTQAAFLALNLAYYAVAAYLLTGVLLKFLAPVMMKTTTDLGLRNRLSAGGIALAKILFTAVMLNVWYIAHAPEPNPQRLLSLPQTLQNSTLMQMSDANWAQHTAEFMQSHGFLALPASIPPAEPTAEETIPTS